MKEIINHLGDVYAVLFYIAGSLIDGTFTYLF